MDISDFEEAGGNELEAARTRFGAAEVAVETARREWEGCQTPAQRSQRCCATGQETIEVREGGARGGALRRDRSRSEED